MGSRHDGGRGARRSGPGDSRRQRRRAEGRGRQSPGRSPLPRRPPAATARQRRLRRRALHDRARLRPGRQHVRLGPDHDHGAVDRTPARAQPRLPGRPRRHQRQGRRARGRVPRRSSGDARPQPDPDGHPADEARGRAAPVDAAEAGPGLHRGRRVLAATPQPIVDPDKSIEGWIPACYPLNPPQTCDGAFVVDEPMGAQSWFPSNNYPTDKATFDTSSRSPTPRPRSASASSSSAPPTATAPRRGTGGRTTHGDLPRRRRPSATSATRPVDGRDVDRAGGCPSTTPSTAPPRRPSSRPSTRRWPPHPPRSTT